MNEDDVFGYGGSTSGDNPDSSNANNGNGEYIDDLGTKPNTGNVVDNPSNPEPADTDDNSNTDDANKNDLVEGTSIEVGDDTYTVDKEGNLVDKDGNIFKKAEEVKSWMEGFEQENTDDVLSIDSIQNAVGISITDDDNKPVVFENTPSGVKAYIDAVIETSRNENYETAINTLYQKYPIINDVLNYYIANGNSLEGFGEVQDRSNITIDDNNETQQEMIVRQAWKEQNRKGDVDSYIQYLKASGTLLATAKEELEGMQEADREYRENLQREAERVEAERVEEVNNYWNGVNEVIKNRKIAGYEIPENIIVNRDGKKISVTPNDFFNYLYLVDKDGHSAYERDLMKETAESRRDDEILRAYLKFVGGNYSNLVDMAINKQKVDKLRLKAKERNQSTIRITKPSNNNGKGDNIDLGY